MADYNVQMKQYNGTSFDNILPYASQALTLAGGGGATEIIAQARAGLSQIATGSYVGTGTYGQSNPTVITCGFKPKFLSIVYCVVDGNGGYANITNGMGWEIDFGSASTTGAVYSRFEWIDGVKRYRDSRNNDIIVISTTDTGISMYSPSSSSEQLNSFISNTNTIYFYVAIG